jgi:hypothetical protein
MKRSVTITICILMLGLAGLYAKDWLTVYNDDLALVRSQFELQLDKGSQFYNFDQITSRINTESVIVKALKGGITVAEQNYEYDLAGTEQILRKYIEKEVSLTTKNNSLYLGTMKFYDGSTVGLIESGTRKLILVNRAEIQQILLAELPSNFYTKPTLRWKLLANKKDKYPLQISYLTGGLSWYVTYNATWDGKVLGLNSWVTLNNQSGRGFENVDLKLIAGEINRVRDAMTGRGNMMFDEDMYYAKTLAAPSFEEKAFHDFHMYTLSEPVSFADRQIKQLQLFPYKNVSASTVYEYRTHTDGVLSKIKFRNTEANGLGIPLPKGVFKIYREDTDKNLEFIGEDNINHTSKNEEVFLTTGKAFDLVGITLIKNTRSLGNRSSENDMQITLRNNSKEEKTIRIVHPRSPQSTILKTGENLAHEQTEDNLYVWEKTMQPDTEFVLTFTERFNY